MAQIFPRYDEEEEKNILICVVSKEEVEGVLKKMQKDETPGPDEWTL